MKSHEEIAEDIILQYLLLKTPTETGWAGMDIHLARKCAIIHAKGIIKESGTAEWVKVLKVLEGL